MILNNLDFFRALDGLGHFVVIHENQSAGDGFEKVGLGQDAGDVAFCVQSTGKIWWPASAGLFTCGSQRTIFAGRKMN